jgi:hypothetical protein
MRHALVDNDRYVWNIKLCKGTTVRVLQFGALIKG